LKVKNYLVLFTNIEIDIGSAILDFKCLCGSPIVMITDPVKEFARDLKKWFTIRKIQQKIRGSDSLGVSRIRIELPQTFDCQPKIVGCLGQIQQSSLIKPPEKLNLLFHDSHFVITQSDPHRLGRLVTVFSIENFSTEVSNFN
jgi:hypothetical protein